jgi:hypothetical protein
MTRDTSMFIDFARNECGCVLYDDNNRGMILGEGVVENLSTTTVKDVMLVKGYKHNLLSIKQLCDNGYINTFNTLIWII